MEFYKINKSISIPVVQRQYNRKFEIQNLDSFSHNTITLKNYSVFKVIYAQWVNNLFKCFTKNNKPFFPSNSIIPL